MLQRARLLMQPTQDWNKYAAINRQEVALKNGEDGHALNELVVDTKHQKL